MGRREGNGTTRRRFCQQVIEYSQEKEDANLIFLLKVDKNAYLTGNEGEKKKGPSLCYLALRFGFEKFPNKNCLDLRFLKIA